MIVIRYRTQCSIELIQATQDLGLHTIGEVRREVGDWLHARTEDEGPGGRRYQLMAQNTVMEPCLLSFAVKDVGESAQSL